ncbi:type VI secretion system membrane subunit TssM [Endozoicomonas arenosclerae]|uniref:type VI secretion system membrane subunit TssM n=1 Tax=Endozoicomonas arenosclerae TaxID=1633495 RepID=UPI00078551D2|nr:type VI secretion system membrane subunit TssM [Endozoicomonas arenosclerae]
MKKIALILVPLAAVVLLLVIWLAPEFFPKMYYWLGSAQRKWFSIVIVAGLLMFFIRPAMQLFKKKGQGQSGNETSEDQQREKCLKERIRDLEEDWCALWAKLKELDKAENPYSLPWLLIMGSEGSGKSSWLVDIGFEKVSRSHDKALGIVFWVSEQAVIIEWNGDEHSIEDSEEDLKLWQTLTRLISRKRPRQPLTGLFMTLSIDQLLSRHPNSLLELARQVRRCLQELYRQCPVRLPMWLLLTQFDRLSGFADYFRRQSDFDQSSPFGFALKDGYDHKQCVDAFSKLHHSLYSALQSTAYQEKDTEARKSQVRFFLQFTLLGERLSFFCDETFKMGTQQGFPELKGVWLSSCDQHGSALNLLATDVGMKHGFSVKSEQHQTTERHSYFTRSFLSSVVMQDLNNVGESARGSNWLRRRYLGYTLLGVVLIGGVSFCLYQVYLNSLLVDSMKTVSREYSDATAKLGAKPTFPQVIQPLTSLQRLDSQFQQSERFFWHLGMMDTDLAEKVHQTYLIQLNKWLSQPLADHLHSRLEDALGHHQEKLVDIMMFYLMLFYPKLMDQEVLTEHVMEKVREKQDLTLSEQNELNQLLRDLLSRPLKGIQPDQKLIDKVRNQLAGHSDEEMVYDYIQTHGHYGQVSLEVLLGQDVMDVFEAADGRHTGFPSFYTRAVYDRLDLTENSGLIRQAVSILNLIKSGTAKVSSDEMKRISAQVRELYFQDYIRHWQSLLGSLRLRNKAGLSQTTQQVTQLFQGEKAVLFELIHTISWQTQLAHTPPPDTEKSETTADSGKSGEDSQQESGAKSKPSGQQTKKTAPSDPGVVNQAFKGYAGYTGEKVGKITQALAALLVDLNKIQAEDNNGLGFYEQTLKIMKGESNSLDKIEQIAAADSTQVHDWLEQLVQQVLVSYVAGAASYIQFNWSETVFPFWQKYLSNYFPFQPSVSMDANLSDFIEFFKPEGVLRRFVAGIAAPFLESGRMGWEVKSVRGQRLPLDDNFLRQLSNAEVLTRAFFTADGRLQINYRMRCTDLSDQTTDIVIRDAGGRFTYSHGPQLWQERKWPGSMTENMLVTFSRDSVVLGQTQFSGAWAWFHFVFACQQWRSDRNVELQYALKGFKAVLEIDPMQSTNPFNPMLFTKVSFSQKITR